MNSTGIPQIGVSALINHVNLSNPIRTVDDDISTPELAAELLTTLSVVGFAEMTAATSKLFREKVCAALNGHTIVEIDLSQTTFMDCASLGALIAIRNSIRGRNGVLRIVNPTSSVRQFLDLVRAGQIFEIVNRSQESESDS